MSSLLHGLKQQIPRAALLLLASLGGMILYELSSLLPPHVLDQLDKLIMLKVILILILILIAILLIGCLLTWIYYLKLAIKDNVSMFDYEQPPELGGVSKHKKSGKLFLRLVLLISFFLRLKQIIIIGAVYISLVVKTMTTQKTLRLKI